ncbi:MAG: hypothetical protein ABI585_09855 [Betaproteobacteria bacterium]
MLIRHDDLTGRAIRALLDEHLAGMRAVSPPESCHALGVGALRKPDISDRPAPGTLRVRTTRAAVG